MTTGGASAARRLDASPVSPGVTPCNTRMYATVMLRVSELPDHRDEKSEICRIFVNNAASTNRLGVSISKTMLTYRDYIPVTAFRIVHEDATNAPGHGLVLRHPTDYVCYVTFIRRTPPYHPSGMMREPIVMPNYIHEATEFIAAASDSVFKPAFIAHHRRLRAQHRENPKPYLVHRKADVRRRVDGRGRRRYFTEPEVRVNFEQLARAVGANQPVSRETVDAWLNAADAMRDTEYHRQYVRLKAEEMSDRWVRYHTDEWTDDGGPPEWWAGGEFER